MKKKILILCAALLGIILLFTAGYFVINALMQGEAEEPIAQNESADYTLNEFDSALIEYLCTNGYEYSDFMISPAAFRASLGLAAAGAQGNTRVELVRAMSFSGLESFNSWYMRLKNSEETFSVRSSIWANKDLLAEFTDDYSEKVKEAYRADACSIASDEMTDAINDWMNEQSEGAVSSAENGLNGASSVILSTLKLDAAFKNAFSEAKGHDGVFTGRDGDEHTMGFVERTGNYLYADVNGTQIVVIPLEGNLSFVCFLGNRIDMFDKMTELQPAKVHVVLPKFDIESGFDASDFSGFLLSRGVRDAINENTSNFYNMCLSADWFVQEIIQKTHLTLNEGGVGSLAVSASAGTGSSSGDAAEFIADRPFSFAVFSDFGEKSHHMLLYGQIMN